MKNESPLPQAPPPPREIPFKKSVGYAWAGLLLGGILLVDGIITAVIFQTVITADLSKSITVGLPVVLGVPGLVSLLLAQGRIRRRRRLLESGRAITGKVLSCEPKKNLNPPPWVLTFGIEDTLSGQTIQGVRWFHPKMWSWSQQPPRPGQECLVALDEGLTQRMEILAVEGWQAWED